MIQGKIRCIIVKDVSRIGRTYLEVGDFFELVFKLKIRFISINDYYDTNNILENTNGLMRMDIVLKTILHSYSSRKLSYDILQARKALNEEGKFVGSRPPYGYLINPNNRYELIIDENIKQVVKLIFSMFLEGYSTSDIVQTLNFKEIETPVQRLNRLGIKNQYYDETNIKKNVWRTPAVRAILKNPVVTGTVRNHIRERKEYGKNATRQVNEDEVILVPDKHEAIIKSSDFDKVQAIFKAKSEKKNYSNVKGKENLFREKIFCAECNSVLYVVGSNKRHTYYRCVKHRLSTDIDLHKVSIRYEVLIDKMMQELDNHKKNFSDIGKINITKKRIQEKKLDEDNIKILEQKKKKLQDSIASYYEQYIKKLITKEEFMSKKQSLQNDMLEFEQKTYEEHKPEKKSDLQGCLVKQDYDIKKLINYYINNIYLYKNGSIKVNWRI